MGQRVVWTSLRADLRHNSTRLDAFDKYETFAPPMAVINARHLLFQWPWQRQLVWYKVHLVRINWKMLCARCRSVVKCVAARLGPRTASRSKADSINSEYFTPPTFGQLEVTEQAPLVNAYTTNGFVIRNNFVYGSVALLPRTLLHWKVHQHILCH